MNIEFAARPFRISFGFTRLPKLESLEKYEREQSSECVRDSQLRTYSRSPHMVFRGSANGLDRSCQRIGNDRWFKLLYIHSGDRLCGFEQPFIRICKYENNTGWKRRCRRYSMKIHDGELIDANRRFSILLLIRIPLLKCNIRVRIWFMCNWFQL